MTHKCLAIILFLYDNEKLIQTLFPKKYSIVELLNHTLDIPIVKC